MTLEERAVHVCAQALFHLTEGEDDTWVDRENLIAELRAVLKIAKAKRRRYERRQTATRPNAKN